MEVPEHALASTIDRWMDLVHRAQQGDTSVYFQLVRAYLRPAYVIALAMVGGPAEAEAIAQEALSRALGRIGAFGEARQFASWLFARVRRRARHLLRKRRFRGAPDVVGSGERDSRPPEIVGVRRAVISALLVLDEARREVVLLHDLAGWAHWQIAEALGISEADSRQQLFEARRILHDNLGGRL